MRFKNLYIIYFRAGFGVYFGGRFWESILGWGFGFYLGHGVALSKGLL